MITIIFIILAAICNAAMDNMEPWNFYSSAFNRWGWPERFWNREKSSGVSKTIFGWKFDGWHCAKSLMVIFFCIAIVFYSPFIMWFNSGVNRAIEFCIFGAMWNIVNPNFYKKIFG